MKIRDYQFTWNTRQVVISSDSLENARAEFMERFGFYPELRMIEFNLFD